MRAWLGAVLLLAAGCDRSFDPGRPAVDGGLRLPLRSPCEGPRDCLSDACVEGLCCERACAADESCAAPGRAGLCTPRPAGAACDEGRSCSGAAVCTAGVCCDRPCDAAGESCTEPGSEGTCLRRERGAACDAARPCYDGGTCFEGLCCERACGGCETCAAPGALGRCTPAPDNTDPKQACAPCEACQGGVCGLARANSDPKAECGHCGACYAGACGPARVGSDPKRQCPAGQACGLGQACATDLRRGPAPRAASAPWASACWAAAWSATSSGSSTSR